MKRPKILFADDERDVLEGLERSFRRHRGRWSMVFAGSSREALSALEGQRFDVIVSDMRMPGVDGAGLLGEAKKRHPSSVRFVLSGYSDQASTMRAMAVAHQYLAKPFKPEMLVSLIAGASALLDDISDESMKEIVGGTDYLPSQPAVARALSIELAQSKTSVQKVTNLVRQDVALFAKLLQMVNSGFVGSRNRTTNARTAVTSAGLQMMRCLGDAAARSGQIPGWSAEHVERTERLARHSALTARIAARLAPKGVMGEDVAAAAMLHDVGKLILLRSRGDELLRAEQRAEQGGLPIQTVEQEVFGTSHAEMGASLLALWGLPWTIVEAVAHHHSYEPGEGARYDAGAALYFANILAEQVEVAEAWDDNMLSAQEWAALERIGMRDKPTAWWAMAKEELATP